MIAPSNVYTRETPGHLYVEVAEIAGQDAGNHAAAEAFNTYCRDLRQAGYVEVGSHVGRDAVGIWFKEP